MRKFIVSGILGLLLLIAGSAFGQTVTSVEYQWTASIEGSPAVEYTVQYRVDGGNWIDAGVATTTSWTFENLFEYHKTYEVRIAGVDKLGRQGPFSDPSDPYMPDLGPPGAPGIPTITQVID